MAEPLLYARVDLVRMPGGEPVLIELELTEPYLYLDAELEARRPVRALAEGDAGLTVLT